MNFQYVAVGKDRRVVQGIISASAEMQVEEWLKKSQLRPLSIRAAARSSTLMKGLFPESKNIKRQDLVHFFQQMATLMNSGVPLLTALQLLRDNSRRAGYRELLDSMIAELNAGSSLNRAMAKKPKAFPSVYIRLVEAGEKSGKLETVFRHLAAYLQREMAIVQRIQKAMMYPAIVIGVAVVVLGVLITMVLPSLSEMLAGFDTELPITTRIVIGFSNFMQEWQLLILLVASLMPPAFILFARSREGKKILGRVFLKAPGFSQITIQRNMAHFSRTMSLMLNAGLPLPDCLGMAKDGMPNSYFQQALNTVRTRVMEGEGLSKSLQQISFMPPLYIQMIASGEQAGTLESNLASMADFYEREVEDRLVTMTSLIEPVMTIGLGCMIAFIALSVLMPMFSLMDVIGGKQ